MAIITNNPTANDPPSWLDAVWSALYHWRDELLEEGDEADDKDWDEITTSMAWITEALDCEIDSNGDIVYAEPECKIVQCTNGVGEWELIIKDGGSEVFDTFEEASNRALELFPIHEHDVLARNSEPDPKVRQEIRELVQKYTK